MPEPAGNLCIVLHGHLPYVLHHGDYPHGEAWLFEAAAETYLPLLDMIGEVALMQKRPGLTIGLTPVLLEQLAHPRFKERFVAYLDERIERAQRDRADFEKKGEKHFAYLAAEWTRWHERRREHFERIGRDIPGEFARRFAEGHIQILTSNATHCYMPLVLNDEMLAAQMACGTATSERHLGVRPQGMWLPECAYRPHWPHWMPSVLYDNPRDRPGLERFMQAAGVTHFFVESHLIQNASPMGYREGGRFHSGGGYRPGSNRPLEPVGVVSEPGEPHVFAFARHPHVSEQVWSGSIGYPADGAYLEFHRKHGERGLRYHKITSTKTALSAKDPYYPDDISAKLYEHAAHFCDVVRRTLWQYRNETGRRGTVVASFDAELFGHWWFEGVRFLRDVILTLANMDDVKLATAQEALASDPPDKVMRLPEGSWGENGDHTVWANDRVKWVWEMEYRAEGTFLRLLHSLPWREDQQIRQVMERAARELLLLQASDWPFVIHTGGATDYGIERIAGHSTRFNRLTNLAERLGAGGDMTELDRVDVAEVDGHDNIFQEIDLNWWIR
jgi:1,4-alpha-glucan branching enzyme